jgi:hypothetical protein
LEFNAAISYPRAPALVEEFAYAFGLNHERRVFGMRRRGPVAGEYDLINEGYEIKRNKSRAWPLPSPIKCYGFPDQVNADYKNAGFLNQFSLAFQELLDGVYYLGPLRQAPERQYGWSGRAPSGVGAGGKEAVAALLASRSRAKIPRGKGRPAFSVEQYVGHWLKELGLVDDFAVSETFPGSSLYELWIRQFSQSPEILITDVGFGISQVLPVLVLCYYVPEGSTIILEQPEIHLHPFAQTGLADVLIDAMKTRKVQIILESHSEHLLLRLQRRVAEQAISPDKLALYFCERTDTGSRLKSLDLDQYGNITNWPAGFFGDEFAERAEMMKNIARRRMEKAA